MLSPLCSGQATHVGGTIRAVLYLVDTKNICLEGQRSRQAAN
jgi:hypothetical protein